MEFEIIRAYAKAQVIEDGWARTPLILSFLDDTREGNDSFHGGELK